MPRKPRSIDYYLNRAEEISETTALKAGTISYIPMSMATVSLPVRDVDGNTYSRRNGQHTLTMTAGDGNKLPYGTYVRLLVIFFTTESKITGSNEVYLGKSQAQFFRSMGLKSSGGENGTARAVRKQIQRLLTCNFLWHTSSDSSWSMSKISISNEAKISWNLTRADSLECYIKLSDEFFTDIKERAVPIDRRVIDAVSHYPMAIDIYCWLTYR